MNTFLAVIRDFQAFFNVRTKRGVIHFVVALLIVAGAIGLIISTQAIDEADTSSNTRLVVVASVSSLSGNQDISVLGEVRSLSEATIRSEVTGRVTSVSVSLGQEVRAGQEIARVENASQYAALLQAQGGYEAALASAQQSGVSVTSAQTALASAEDAFRSAYNQAYATFSDVLFTTVDDFFANPEASLPGLKIRGYSYTQQLNSERVAFQSIEDQWQLRTQQSGIVENMNSYGQQAISNAERLIDLISILQELVNMQEQTATLEGSPVESYNATLLAEISTLRASLNNVQNAISSVQAAEESLERAQLAGSSDEPSLASAQVKQALGSLRAAEANYQKTIFTSPLSGVVQELPVSSGDFVSTQDQIAYISSPGGLEIVTYVNESDAGRISIGQEVVIDDTVAGTITAIAPSVGSQSRKIEVRVAAQGNELLNGDTVRVNIPTEQEIQQEQITIPITALKVETDRTVVFTVRDDNTLESHEVIVGPLSGSNIYIEEGVTSNIRIVLDARGLNEGQEVMVEQR